MPILLKDLTSDELQVALAPLGVKPRLARQIQAAAVRCDAPPELKAGMSPRVLQRVREHAVIPRLSVLDKTVSPRDGFAKYLLRGDGPDPFEAVCIPLLHRPDDCKCVVCVSCQVGCAMGCVFCRTAGMGFRRNLSAWEMVDQVIRVQADTPYPVRGVVFMGMGEPMLNYDAVIRAARILSEPCGMAIAAKAISISTAGVTEGIRRFTAQRQPYRLVVSLTAADPARRLALMPVERACPTPDLIQALREYHAVTARRVTLAWTMMAGVNIGEQDAKDLANLTRGLPIKLDLIDVNDPTGRFRPPSQEELDAFRDALRAHVGAPVARRYSGGQDIHAACGMLAGMRIGQERQP